jgi:hypothetical protein
LAAVFRIGFSAEELSDAAVREIQGDNSGDLHGIQDADARDQCRGPIHTPKQRWSLAIEPANLWLGEPCSVALKPLLPESNKSGLRSFSISCRATAKP